MTNAYRPSVKAVLFDLDDTLFDHLYSSQCALKEIQQQHLFLQTHTLADIEQRHLQILNELHIQMLRNEMTMDEARIERFRQLFQHFGAEDAQQLAEAAAITYRDIYQSSRQVVPGTIPLLVRLHQEVKIGVITNNLLTEQLDKIRRCQLEPFIDVLVTSEEAGAIKPEPEIFQLTLQRLACQPDEAVMIGDSWSADILGAHSVGIRSIWLNRMNTPCPDPTITTEIRAFEPLEDIVKLVLTPA